MFKHILVPLDGSNLAECVLPHVVAMAELCSARITLLHVLGRNTDAVQGITLDTLNWHLEKAEFQAYLEAVRDRLQRVGVEAQPEVVEGRPAEQIIDFVAAQDVDLVILSSHGRGGLSGWNVSSAVQKILMRAYVSTLLVRAYQPGEYDLGELHYRRLLVPLDCSRRAECVLPFSTMLAKRHEAEILLTHVVREIETPCSTPPNPRREALVKQVIADNRELADGYLSRVIRRLPGTVEKRLLVAPDVTTALYDLMEKEQVSLVVVSAHGHAVNPKWPYGTLAVGLIVYGTAPLLIVQDLPSHRRAPTKAELAALERKGH